MFQDIVRFENGTVECFKKTCFFENCTEEKFIKWEILNNLIFY